MELHGICWLLTATSLAGLAQASVLWRNQPFGKHQPFTRVHFLSSLIQGDYLYLDGGEITGSNSSTSLISATTLRIDLTSSWTTTTITADYVDKPRLYPFDRQPTLWSDGSNLYAAGGIPFYFIGCIEAYACLDPIWMGASRQVIGQKGGKDAPSSPPYRFVSDSLATTLGKFPKWQVWEIPLKNFAQNKWSLSSNQAPDTISDLQASLSARSGDRIYALGGFSGYPFATTQTNQVYPVPGLASWNVDGSDWQNHSSSKFQPNGFTAMGQAIPAPFGEQGIIVYIGGYAPPGPFQYADYPFLLADMSQINVFDIASGTFITQNATGDIPHSRWSFCAVGVSEIGSETFDIFVFGGFATTRTQEAPDISMKSLYVLSLPSFKWTKIPGPLQEERSSLTCKVIGNRHMAIIGGVDPTNAVLGYTADPWPNGIGLFDMSEWKFTERYNPKAPPYERADVLVQLNHVWKYPRQWDSDAAKQLFQNTSWTPPSQNDQDSGPDVGAIAGGVVGAVLGVALILGFFFVWRWRRKQTQRSASKGKFSDDEGFTKAVEAPDNPKFQELPTEAKPSELGPEPRWELANTEQQEDDPSMGGSEDTRVDVKANSQEVIRHELEG